MGDDAYEFLGPDLLAPPAPAAEQAATPGTQNKQEPKQPTNELAPVSAAEKFQVKPAPATSKSKSKSKESGEGRKKPKGKKKSKRSKEPEEALPSLSSLKTLIVVTGILIFVSVAITLMVLIDGLT